jgi:phosphohistidine phosphatase
MKRLLIMRHGKSDWYSEAASDHARPLNRRGTESAMTMGRVVSNMGEVPDLIYTSSATRARETAMLAADAGEWGCEMVDIDDLYETSAGGALAVAARAPDVVERLMLVGHQPTWGYLVHSLTGASVHMKTATVAAIDLMMTSWRHAPEARGTLAFLLQPRMFTDWEM